MALLFQVRSQHHLLMKVSEKHDRRPIARPLILVMHLRLQILLITLTPRRLHHLLMSHPEQVRLCRLQPLQKYQVHWDVRHT